MGMVSRCMWVESMGVASGCGCKEVYRFPHIYYLSLLLLYLFFFQQHPYFCSIKKMLFFFLSFSSTFL